MQTWFDAQLDQKILDGLYSADHHYTHLRQAQWIQFCSNFTTEIN